MEVQKDAHHKFSYLAWQMAMSQARQPGTPYQFGSPSCSVIVVVQGGVETATNFQDFSIKIRLE